MSLIEELYYGEIAPCEQRVIRTAEDKETLSKIVQYEKGLLETLNPQQKEMFERYQYHHDKLWSHEECAAFVNGFKLGARFVLEIVDR